MSLQKELEISKQAAIKAGKEIMRVYNSNFSVEYKKDESPLTEADKRANDIIVNMLKENFSSYSILSEESKDDKTRLNNDWCWIVDPLDGTKEFVAKKDDFTVNIALSYKHKAVLGLIYIPVSDELYYAIKGEGAYFEKDGNLRKINVSDKLDDVTMTVSRFHASDKLKKVIKDNNIKKTVTVGSAIKGCYISRGDAEIYYRFGPTMEWDTAAMQCIVEEAGGIFRQMDDSEMLYNRKNTLNEKGFYVLNNSKNKLNIK